MANVKRCGPVEEIPTRGSSCLAQAGEKSIDTWLNIREHYMSPQQCRAHHCNLPARRQQQIIIVIPDDEEKSQRRISSKTNPHLCWWTLQWVPVGILARASLPGFFVACMKWWYGGAPPCLPGSDNSIIFAGSYMALAHYCRAQQGTDVEKAVSFVSRSMREARQVSQDFK